MIVHRIYGYAIVEVLDDDGRVDGYDVTAPCADERHDKESARCDCHLVGHSIAYTRTLAEARAEIRRLRELDRDIARVERLFGGAR